jgi:hypothetical protein
MIYPDVVPTVFCIYSSGYPHYYRMKKKQQFEMSQQEIEQEEKKKLAAIIAEKQAWEKNGTTIPPRE